MSATPVTKAKWVSREARIEQLISAACDSIARVGYADTTLATVAREAGMSQASVVFYFKSKDALLTETLRVIALEFRETWQEAVARAPDDPLSKLLAFVSAGFAPKVCNRKILAVWHAFYGEAKSRPSYMKICGDLDDQRHEALSAAIEAVLAADGKPTDRAEELALMIDAFGDGLWLNMLTLPEALSRRQALHLAYNQLCALLPDHAQAIRAWELRG